MLRTSVLGGDAAKVGLRGRKVERPDGDLHNLMNSKPKGTQRPGNDDPAAVRNRRAAGERTDIGHTSSASNWQGVARLCRSLRFGDGPEEE
jgi:hypothetical protein